METVNTFILPLPERTHAHKLAHSSNHKSKKKNKKITAVILIANIFWFMSGYTPVNTDKSCVRLSYTALPLQHQS